MPVDAKTSFKPFLWTASAGLLGAAMPTMLFGKTVMYVLILLGLACGLAATRGESLRASMKLMLNSWHVLLAVGFLVWALVGSMLGIDPSFALHKWSELLILATLSGVLFLTLREMPGAALDTMMTTLAVGAGLAMGLALLDAFWGNAAFGALLHGADKATTPYRLNFLSGALAVMLPFVWCHVWMKAREGEAWAERFGLPLAMLSVATVIICGGRAGWVGMVVGLAVFLAAMGKYHGFVPHARHWKLAALTLLVGLGGYALSHGMGFFMERVTIVEEGGRGPLSGRLDVWLLAVRHLLDNPLWGIGVQNFRNLPAGPGLDAHPHNWALQLILETGFVGFGLFVALMGLVAYQFLRYGRTNPWGVAALAALAAFLTAGLGNTSLFNVWWGTYLMMVLMVGWRVAWSHPGTRLRRDRLIKRGDLVAEGKPRKKR